MPVVETAFLAKTATKGFALARKAKLGQKALGALRKGFGLLKDKAKDAKFVATEKGFTLTAPGISAQGGQASSQAGRVAYSAPGSANYLPYIIGGAVLLMLMKK